MTNRILFGAARPFSNASYLKSIGFDFIECAVSEVLMPTISNEEYEPHFQKFAAPPLPIRSCYCFIPGNFKLTGPEINHVGALKYAKVALQRADKLGIPFIVFGSGGARTFPDGFPKEEAVSQFISFCNGLAEILNEMNVTVVIEPLQKRETNLINSLSEGAEIIRAVGSKKVRLLADFYHMRSNGEEADGILKHGDLLYHCHIAEKIERRAPGTTDEDFSSYFAALKKIGYKGGISCECDWLNFESDAKNAIAALHKFASH